MSIVSSTCTLSAMEEDIVSKIKKQAILDGSLLPPAPPPNLEANQSPKTRWVCPECDHLNSYKKQSCIRPGCSGRKQVDHG